MGEGTKKAPVSVVIPCYNCASTLERAVASVAAQTLQPAEIILVDDASVDDTREVMQKIRRLYDDNWIKVLFLPKNVGPGDARNAGWDTAAEPFIAFLDADDTWHSRKIEIQYQWMAAHPEVLFTGHPCVWGQKHDLAQELSGDCQARRIMPRQLLLSNYFPTPSVMLCRELPCRFLAGKRYSEDYLLWLQIVLSGNQAWRLDQPLTYLYKAPFGEAGLSADLWTMEKGELETYQELTRLGLISKTSCLIYKFLSVVKYGRRKVLGKI
ncbi:MAG: glycosyltransferase family 2 protein [Acidobacteriota bacterium]